MSPKEQHQSRELRKRLSLTCEDEQIEVGGSKVLSTGERGRGPSGRSSGAGSTQQARSGGQAQSRARRASGLHELTTFPEWDQLQVKQTGCGAFMQAPGGLLVGAVAQGPQGPQGPETSTGQRSSHDTWAQSRPMTRAGHTPHPSKSRPFRHTVSQPQRHTSRPPSPLDVPPDVSDSETQGQRHPVSLSSCCLGVTHPPAPD